MKFYIGDYLGDTQHLTTLQHGAYLLLIMAYWQRRGPLPMDDDKLARIARCTLAEWMQCKSDVLAFFDEREGMLHQNRIDRELEGIVEISEKRRGAARKKWETISKGDASALQVDSNSNAKDMLSHIHIPYSNKEDIKSTMRANSEEKGYKTMQELVPQFLASLGLPPMESK